MSSGENKATQERVLGDFASGKENLCDYKLYYLQSNTYNQDFTWLFPKVNKKTELKIRCLKDKRVWV